MHLLFPDNPLDPREVEPDFADQAAAAEGFSRHLVSIEDLLAGAAHRAVRRVPEGVGPCLYRGWMLKPTVYAALAEASAARGAPFVVPPAAYAYAHHLPGWYADFRLVTAATEWTSSGSIDDALAALRRLLPGPALVKDYVKSVKHRWAEACFIPDSRDDAAARAVIGAFLDEQGDDLNGGVVLRAFRPYPTTGTEVRTGMPVIAERRLFLWRGTPLPIDGDEASIVGEPRLRDAIRRLRSPFVSLDLARLDDGTWEVVEVGDGQVSGLRDTDPAAFFARLRESSAAG